MKSLLVLERMWTHHWKPFLCVLTIQLQCMCVRLLSPSMQLNVYYINVCQVLMEVYIHSKSLSKNSVSQGINSWDVLIVLKPMTQNHKHTITLSKSHIYRGSDIFFATRQFSSPLHSDMSKHAFCFYCRSWKYIWLCSKPKCKLHRWANIV